MSALLSITNGRGAGRLELHASPAGDRFVVVYHRGERLASATFDTRRDAEAFFERKLQERAHVNR